MNHSKANQDSLVTALKTYICTRIREISKQKKKDKLIPNYFVSKGKQNKETFEETDYHHLQSMLLTTWTPPLHLLSVDSREEQQKTLAVTLILDARVF